MTPAEINAAIAGWMGWTDISPTFHVGFDPDTGQPRPIPNFHGDLNACRDAWLHLDEQKQWEFGDELDMVIERAMPKSDIYRQVAVAANATAPQRCEALLRTLNLWKE